MGRIYSIVPEVEQPCASIEVLLPFPAWRGIEPPRASALAAPVTVSVPLRLARVGMRQEERTENL